MTHIDFETFSTAGYRWDPEAQKWERLEGASASGLPGVGAEVYAMHPSTRVICIVYNGTRWRPGAPDPVELLDHVRAGGILTAHNSQFEWWIWRGVCVRKHGWPELPLANILDTAPRCRAWGIPGSLAESSRVLGLADQKDKRGPALIRRFSIPRNPTKLDKRLVTLPHDDPEAAEEFEQYCEQDVAVETALDAALPQLTPTEQRVWELDQRINVRGVPVDVASVDAACEVLRQADRVLNSEIKRITGGAVETHAQRTRVIAFCASQGVHLTGYTADQIAAALEGNSMFQLGTKVAVDGALDRGDLPPVVRRVLEIRQQLGSTSTGKVWAFATHVTAEARIHGTTLYCGAHTGRWAGRVIQPQNMPRGDADSCLPPGEKWSPDVTDRFLADLQCRDFVALQSRWGDVLRCMAASLRGLICASPGHELIASDYTAIEAVVLAVLAGEQWRIDVFRTHGKIYESSAAKITGKSLEFYAEHKERTGSHHPDRALGKTAELASGYQGGVNAWKNPSWDATKFFTSDRCEEYRDRWERDKRRDQYTLQDYAVQCQVWAWRRASPMVVKLWEGLETAALNAIRDPGMAQRYRLLSYVMEPDGVLYCQLPSGRRIAYHRASIGVGRFGKPNIVFWGNNSDRLKGPIGWIKMDTYGGKLTENATQAVARDILAHGMLGLDAAGYPIVMHVHDEAIAEVPEGFGSVEEYERIMSDMPTWARGWPIRAAGGWRGKRFRK
jgi:DNA polymerase